jgi:hypothetical protein
MSIVDEVVGKRFSNEGFIERNVFEILKEILFLSSSLLHGFFDLHPFSFYLDTPFITPSLTTNVIDESLWSINGNDIYV